MDALAGELIARVGDDSRWMILSDHGFARVRGEVNVNALLRDAGLLRYSPADAMNLDPIEVSSKVFSLLPGRIYINLAGREKRGCVAQEDYESVVRDVAQVLTESRHPETGEALFAAVHRTRDVYSGPLLPQACDLIAIGREGLDLRAGFRAGETFAPASHAGIHTYGDAFVIADEILSGDEATIRDVGRRIGDVLL